jgi:transcriptional regulator with XRE-family HTH domain
MTRSTITITVRREVLRSWLTVSDCTASRMASKLNVSRGRVSQLLNSDQELSARLIAGLLHLTKLPFDRLFTVKPLKEAVPKNGATQSPAPGEVGGSKAAIG